MRSSPATMTKASEPWLKTYHAGIPAGRFFPVESLADVVAKVSGFVAERFNDLSVWFFKNISAMRRAACSLRGVATACTATPMQMATRIQILFLFMYGGECFLFEHPVFVQVRKMFAKLAKNF